MQRCPVESSNNARAFMLWRKREEFFFEAFSRGVVEQQNNGIPLHFSFLFLGFREKERKNPLDKREKALSKRRARGRKREKRERERERLFLCLRADAKGGDPFCGNGIVEVETAFVENVKAAIIVIGEAESISGETTPRAKPKSALRQSTVVHEIAIDGRGRVPVVVEVVRERFES